jgi:hypothetical protein
MSGGGGTSRSSKSGSSGGTRCGVSRMLPALFLGKVPCGSEGALDARPAGTASTGTDAIDRRRGSACGCKSGSNSSPATIAISTTKQTKLVQRRRERLSQGESRSSANTMSSGCLLRLETPRRVGSEPIAQRKKAAALAAFREPFANTKRRDQLGLVGEVGAAGAVGLAVPLAPGMVGFWAAGRAGAATPDWTL